MKKSMTRRKSLRKKSITRKKSLRKKFMTRRKSLRKKSITRRKSLRKKLKDGMDNPTKSEKISELEKRQEALRKNNDGWTALMVASHKGNIGIVKLLLDRKDIDVNSKSNDGWTALMIASQEENIDIVKLLLDRNTCYCNTSFDNTTALEIAVEMQNENIVKILLEHSKKQHMNSLEKSIKQRTRKITKLFDDIYKIKCSVCLEKQVDILFDCGHAVTCRECFDELPLPKCPICRQNITQIYSNIEAREFNSI